MVEKRRGANASGVLAIRSLEERPYKHKNYRDVEQPLVIVALPDHHATDAMTKAEYIKTHSRSL